MKDGTFSSIQAEDRGFYSCNAANEYGNVHSSAFLKDREKENFI